MERAAINFALQSIDSVCFVSVRNGKIVVTGFFGGLGQRGGGALLVFGLIDSHQASDEGSSTDDYSEMQYI
jgi:hypothetical protein